MVSFARKASNIHEDLKKSSSGGGAGYLRGIKAGKDLRVRFLQDPTEWLEFREHYAKSTGFFPCGAEDGYCGGCESDDDQMRRAGTKYIAQVLVQHEDGAKDIGQVKALKVPRTLANRLTARAERNGGTLLNRDYTIIRSGQGIDTEYDVETEDKAPLDLSKYAHVDVDAILSQMWEENAPKAPLRSVPTEVPATVDNRKARVPSVTETMLAAAPAPATEEDTPPF